MLEDQKDLMTTEELCELLHVTRKTIYRWRMDGKLKAYRVGRQNLYAREDVEAFVRSKSVNCG